MALALLANGRMIDRLGSRRLAVGISVAFVLVGIAGAVVTLGAGGVPSIWTLFT